MVDGDDKAVGAVAILHSHVVFQSSRLGVHLEHLVSVGAWGKVAVDVGGALVGVAAGGHPDLVEQTIGEVSWSKMEDRPLGADQILQDDWAQDEVAEKLVVVAVARSLEGLVSAAFRIEIRLKWE